MPGLNLYPVITRQILGRSKKDNALQGKMEQDDVFVPAGNLESIHIGLMLKSGIG
jgi:hypothetical protein